MEHIQLLDDISPIFPHTGLALEDPNGLLAVGGNLSPKTLISAYSKGIFPWFSDDQPILWWSPNPRMVLVPSELHIGRSLSKAARKKQFEIKVDTAFEQVMEACSEIERPGQDGTWITYDMLDAYIALHEQGVAHSVEAWQDGKLVGGLYGIAIGKAFFGESMFSLVSGASKQAFVSLVMQLQKWEFKLIDCQIHTHYLASFGANELDRKNFERILKEATYIENDSTENDLINNGQDWKNNWTLGTNGYDGFK